MTEYIKARTFAPALRPEDWEDFDEHGVDIQQWSKLAAWAHIKRGDKGEDGYQVIITDPRPYPGDRLLAFDPETAHTVAALCLHGQPFGFTREDLAALQSVCRQNPDNLPGYGLPLHELASKIAALLPPEGA